MTDERLPLSELPPRARNGDFLPNLAEAAVQLLMEADGEGAISAVRYERTLDGATYHNGYGERSLDTRLRSLQLRISKLRQGLATFCCSWSRGSSRRRPWWR